MHWVDRRCGLELAKLGRKQASLALGLACSGLGAEPRALTRLVTVSRTNTFGNPSTGNSSEQAEAGGSAQDGDHWEQPQGDIPPPPPPPEKITIAQFPQVLWEEREANSATMHQMVQVVVNNEQQGKNVYGRSTLSEFMKNSHPTFTETVELMDADDLIHAIKDLLALLNCSEYRERVLYASHCLRGTARAWWYGFKVIQGYHVITWANFRKGFCTTHIPSEVMAIQKREFRAPKQGSSRVKEYL
ncbi:hypothetical protein D1007_00455 [Hordeum vulgare]|nr:hypothetical protein D1007_00455 [Hordeum vulgare]